jgi:hypothetical protein
MIPHTLQPSAPIYNLDGSNMSFVVHVLAAAAAAAVVVVVVVVVLVVVVKMILPLRSIIDGNLRLSVSVGNGGPAPHRPRRRRCCPVSKGISCFIYISRCPGTSRPSSCTISPNAAATSDRGGAYRASLQRHLCSAPPAAFARGDNLNAELCPCACVREKRPAAAVPCNWVGLTESVSPWPPISKLRALVYLDFALAEKSSSSVPHPHFQRDFLFHTHPHFLFHLSLPPLLPILPWSHPALPSAVLHHTLVWLTPPPSRKFLRRSTVASHA